MFYIVTRKTEKAGGVRYITRELPMNTEDESMLFLAMRVAVDAFKEHADQMELEGNKRLQRQFEKQRTQLLGLIDRINDVLDA